MSRHSSERFPSPWPAPKHYSSVYRIKLAVGEARQISGLPTAAERLDQQHAGVHPTQQNVDGIQFVGERNGLGGDDLQVRVYPTLVPIRGQLQEFLRGGDGALLLVRSCTSTRRAARLSSTCWKAVSAV